MVSSTLLTLVVVPALYSLVEGSSNFHKQVINAALFFVKKPLTKNQ